MGSTYKSCMSRIENKRRAMDTKIDEIVKQVLSEIGIEEKVKTFFNKEDYPALTEEMSIKKAVLKKTEEYRIEEEAIPNLRDKEMLVYVEGAMVSKRDVSEFLKEKKVGESINLGSEGCGIVVKMGGKEIKDALGNVMKVGDKVVGLGKSNSYLSYKRSSVDTWYGNYIVIRENTTFYRANDLSLDSRLLLESMVMVENAVQRTMKIANVDTGGTALVMGCTLEGLLTIAILGCLGMKNIIAIDHEKQRDLAKGFGATHFFGTHEKSGISGVQEKIRSKSGGLADMVFNSYTTLVGKNAAKRLAKEGAPICDLTNLAGNLTTSIKYYEESMPISGRYYRNEDYQNALYMLKLAEEKQIPLYRLITHRFLLYQINEAHWTLAREEGMAIAVFNR